MDDKTIVVSDKVYDALLRLKKEEGHKTFNSVILMLLLYYRIGKLSEKVSGKG